MGLDLPPEPGGVAPLLRQLAAARGELGAAISQQVLN
jgi:hypothetical protein